MNTRRMIGGGAVLALAALGVAGCADSTTAPQLDDALLLNAAAVVADATVEDVALATTGFTFGPATVSANGMGGGGMNGGMNGGMGPGEPGGHRGIGGALSGTREVTFYDAAGIEQTAYDALTTASIHFVLDLAGDVTRGPWAASIERTRDMTVTGLENEETARTFNGSGSESVSRSRTLDDGSVVSHDMSGSFTYTDVVVPIPGSDPKWPLSGTIHRTMTVSVVGGLNGDFTKDVDVTVTFNGTSTATALIDGETVEIDLATRQGHFPIHAGRFGRGG